ncbi:MAG: hypothetical protein ACTHQ3_23045 [Motilibacteraceae bacterium]
MPEIVQSLARRGIVPASLHHQFVLLDRPDVLMVVNGFRVWPGGLEFTLELRYPPPAVEASDFRKLPDAIEAGLRVGLTVDDVPLSWFAVDPVTGPANGMEYTRGQGTDCSSTYGWYLSLPSTWERLTIQLVQAGGADPTGSKATLLGEEFRQAEKQIIRSAWTS